MLIFDDILYDLQGIRSHQKRSQLKAYCFPQVWGIPFVNIGLGSKKTSKISQNMLKQYTKNSLCGGIYTKQR